MSQRTILVTGGNGDLGCAVAESFLSYESECRVYLGVRERRSAAEGACARHPGRCWCVDLDVTAPDAWRAAVERILKEQGGLHVLVNNAGMHKDALLATMRPEDWQEVIRTNLDAAFYGC